MDFSKRGPMSAISIRLAYPMLYNQGFDERGDPIKPDEFVFDLRRETLEESLDLQGQALLNGTPESVKRLARLLVSAPEGFDDFVSNGNLAQSAERYFASNPELRIIAKDAMRLYDLKTMPRLLFRSLQSVREPDDHARDSALEAVSGVPV